MDDKILAIYCLCDDILKALHHYEDPQREMTDSEVMTTAVTASLSFGGDFEKAPSLLKSPPYIPNMLSKSRFNRRLHAIKSLFETLFEFLAEAFKDLNTESVYLIDSFPVATCDNIRIPRSRLYHDKAYRGYIASKKRYFYGLKIHWMVTKDGQPGECFLTPGSFAEGSALKLYDLDLPEGSPVYSHKAYTDYDYEDLLREAPGIFLLPIRKKNSKRPLPAYIEYIQPHSRKMIETVGSAINSLFPKTIHALTAQGFELKVFLFVLVYTINFNL